MPTRAFTKFFLPAIFLQFAFNASPAHAYIGPGAGLGAVAVTAALGLGVILLLVGLVWYPLKRTLKKKRKAGDETTKNTPK